MHVISGIMRAFLMIGETGIKGRAISPEAWETFWEIWMTKPLCMTFKAAKQHIQIEAKFLKRLCSLTLRLPTPDSSKTAVKSPLHPPTRTDSTTSKHIKSCQISIVQRLPIMTTSNELPPCFCSLMITSLPRTSLSHWSQNEKKKKAIAIRGCWEGHKAK